MSDNEIIVFQRLGLFYRTSLSPEGALFAKKCPITWRGSSTAALQFAGDFKIS